MKKQRISYNVDRVKAFSLDYETIEKLDYHAALRQVPKSQIVRELIQTLPDYSQPAKSALVA